MMLMFKIPKLNFNNFTLIFMVKIFYHNARSRQVTSKTLSIIAWSILIVFKNTNISFLCVALIQCTKIKYC